MAVEDELRGGAIPDIRPRILTDQVCACVYVFYHPYLPKQSCPKTDSIILTSHPEHWAKPGKKKKRSRTSCTSPVAIFQKSDSITSEIAFHDLLDTPQGTMKTVVITVDIQEMNGEFIYLQPGKEPNDLHLKGIVVMSQNALHCRIYCQIRTTLQQL